MLFVTVLGTFALCWVAFPSANASSVGASCTITDFNHVSEVLNRCTDITIGNLEVPGRKTLHLSLKTGSTLRLTGTIRFAVNNWGGPLVRIDGSGLKVYGSPGFVFDGQGNHYWDGKGSRGPIKPSVLRINVNGGEFYNINIKNCPLHCASIHGSFILLKGWNIDVSAGHSLAYNTDGFDVSGNDITIVDSKVINQDDCIVVNQGKNMLFRNVYCDGGHGLSIATGMDAKIYENNHVSNITFDNCVVANSIEAIHVKTQKGGGPGLIENIVYSRIVCKGAQQFGIRVHQDYPNNDGHPVGNVPIKGLRIAHMRGDVAAVPVNIMCAAGACSNWQWSDIEITGKQPCSMNFKPNGFSC